MAMSAMVLLTKMHVTVVLHHSDIQHLGILRAVTAICLPAGSGDRYLIHFYLKDINTPGRARIHQVSSRNTSLRLQG